MKRFSMFLFVVSGLAVDASADSSRYPAAYIETLKSFQIPDVPKNEAKTWVRELGQSETLFDYYESLAPVSDAKHFLWKTRWVERLTDKDALRERIFYEKDSLKLIRYELEKLQLDEKGWFDVDQENKKVRFEYYKNEEWKKSEDSYSYDLLVGALIPQYLAKKHDLLMKGDDLKISLAVPFMRKVYSFSLEKVGSAKFQGQKLLKVRLRASNFLMRAVVKPLYFFYSPTEKKVKKIEGKVFLKKRIGSDPDQWESFEAESLFINPVQLQ